MSKWYNYNVKCRRDLIILLERSKRPIMFTAGQVFDVSIHTFTKVKYTNCVCFHAYNVFFLDFKTFILITGCITQLLNRQVFMTN